MTVCDMIDISVQNSLFHISLFHAHTHAHTHTHTPGISIAAVWIVTQYWNSHTMQAAPVEHYSSPDMELVSSNSFTVLLIVRVDSSILTHAFLCTLQCCILHVHVHCICAMLLITISLVPRLSLLRACIIIC